MAIVEESYAEFSKRLHAKAAGRRVPVNVDYDVTYRCNLNCRHCYCNLPAGDATARTREIGLDEVRRVLAGARDLGTLWLLFTGGEPLVRDDFREVYLAAVRLGLIPTLFTNGTLVDEQWADFLAEYRPFKIEVTLYGSRAEVYERVTRTPGSFERCLRGVRLLTARGLRVSVKAMVLRSNCDDLAGIEALAADLGLSFRFDAIVHARYPDLARPGDVDPRDERLTVEEVVEADRGNPERSEGWRRICRHAPDLQAPKATRLLDCGAGRVALNVSPDGTIRPCGTLRFMGAGTARTDVGAVWRELMPREMDAPSCAPAECSGCAASLLCQQCAGWAFLENAALDRRVPFLCEVANARAGEFSPAGPGGASNVA